MSAPHALSSVPAPPADAGNPERFGRSTNRPAAAHGEDAVLTVTAAPIEHGAVRWTRASHGTSPGRSGPPTIRFRRVPVRYVSRVVEVVGEVATHGIRPSC
jgi:hypothetical protein